ncbi:DUF177 domain-containing protein [Niveibacterium sp. 24ML]|uniref:YceD family protein n=1 Tax=Niveibacterium sp. 24ML TaxID=2985512 RepID=UPI00226D5ABC|nr:DUF177 domain-containing protein [Niveibacterium sp. 24ML]MCX9158268.1 DUF177 domain-containing protein [Niveibacterium sp. 24ML]
MSGTVEFESMPRFMGELASPQGQVQAEVRGSVVDGECYLEISLEAEPTVVCQRCLKPQQLNLALDARLLLVAPGQPMPDDELEDDSFDPVLADRNLDMLAIIEDELLLGLPISPRHDVCDTPQPRERDDSESPFAALANLRGAGKKR